MRFRPIVFILLLTLPGCGSQDRPETPVSVAPKVVPAAPKAPAGPTEVGVRRILAAQFEVDPSKIAFDQPMSKPPLNADELALVEIVMELEDHFSIVIPDHELDLDGLKNELGEPTVRITPRQLVEIVDRLRSEAKPLAPKK